MPDLAANIRARREALGLTLQAVADRYGCTRQHVHAVEAGRCGVTVGRLARWAAALECNPADLLPTASEGG